MKGILASNPSSPSAPAAHLLIANTYLRQNRPDEAAAAYVELRTKYPSSPPAAEGTFSMAEIVLRSKRPDREQEARGLFGEIATSHPDSPWAPRGLARKATLEERAKLRVVDPQLNTSVPAALVSYRTLVERYPSSEAAEASLAKLGDLYEDLKRYELAARSLDDLAERFPGNSKTLPGAPPSCTTRRSKTRTPPAAPTHGCPRPHRTTRKRRNGRCAEPLHADAWSPPSAMRLAQNLLRHVLKRPTFKSRCPGGT